MRGVGCQVAGGGSACQNVRNVVYPSCVWGFSDQSIGCSSAGPELLSLGLSIIPSNSALVTL